ncbi:MAG: hypothetical protein CM1200mP36_05450 [Gammaproteobacteria bacterium]|nr:MAG: hypothetical protein CM1200mP36_05450 [Gammaproteobacteria bacterium]
MGTVLLMRLVGMLVFQERILFLAENEKDQRNSKNGWKLQNDISLILEY